jgi:hypothetical protein
MAEPAAKSNRIGKKEITAMCETLSVKTVKSGIRAVIRCDDDAD